MPCRYGTTPEHRVLVELVEADIEIGFRLVDMLEALPGETSRLAAAVEDVYAGILSRVQRLQPLEQETFSPLIAELRRSIDLAVPPSTHP